MRPAPKPNIIHITFDGGRADHLGFLGYPKDTSPFLDSLARRGVSFKNAFATGPGSSVSFVGLFTSTYPLDYGGYSYIERPRILVSEVLQKHGYTTIGIHSSPYLSGYFGYDRGWDIFRYLSPFKGGPMSPGLRPGTLKSKILKKSSSLHKRLSREVPWVDGLVKFGERCLLFARKIVKDITRFRPPYFTAEEINNEVKRVLREVPGKPVFLWVHYLDTHAPYGLFGRKGRGFIRKIKYYMSDFSSFLFGDYLFINRLFKRLYVGLYDDSLRYIDDNIKALFHYLAACGILNEHSIVVVNADHGEEFFDHGGFGHDQRLYNSNLRVPLIFYSPKHFSAPHAEERPVSLIDVGPTILALIDVPKPTVFKGRDIFSREGDWEVIAQASDCEADLSNPVFTGATILYGGYKLIHWKDEKLMFTLDDAEEKYNLYGREKEIVKQLEAGLKPYEAFRG